MKPELDNMLCQKYPKIFANRHGDPKETLMCWGFECGDGWYYLLDHLCLNIQHYVDSNNRNFEKGYTQYKQVTQVVAVQVKEKFGSLRFYVDGGDDYTRGMISLAESLSATMCEGCGIPSKVKNNDGWMSNICPVCVSVREQERNKLMKESGFEE
jgi:hypothetical protein